MVVLKMWLTGSVSRVTACGLVVLFVAAGHPLAQNDQVVEMVAERFAFTPSRITIPVGTTVEIRITSNDTDHGFHLVGERNVIITKRRYGEAVVVFEATKPGTYRFECSKLCGAGHNFMRGEIVVTPVGNAGEREERDSQSDVGS